MSKATQIEWSKLIRVKLYNLGVFLEKLIAWTWFKVSPKNNSLKEFIIKIIFYD